MPVTPDEILDSAIKLGSGEAEVDWRNACSRAYFAAFHRCRRIAEGFEPHVELGGSDTIDSFSTSSGNRRSRASSGWATCSTNAES